MRSYYKYLTAALCFIQQTLPSLSKKEIVSLSQEQIASYYLKFEGTLDLLTAKKRYDSKKIHGY